MGYQWPLEKVNESKVMYSTFGEFRGAHGDFPTRLHSGVDIPVKKNNKSNIEIFSPDCGYVRRLQPPGGGPIRVGHFGFNHVSTIFAEPGKAYNGVHMPQHLPIYVCDRSTHIYKPTTNKPKHDHHFKRKMLPSKPTKPAIFYIKKGNNKYEQVVIWPRNLPIAKGISSPKDLHVIYYLTDDGSYGDPRVGNALTQFANYTNGKIPLAANLVMYSQQDDVNLLNFRKSGLKATVVPPHGGVNLKVTALTELKGICGIYDLDYRICLTSILEGEADNVANPKGTTGIVNMWRFDTQPITEQCFGKSGKAPLSGIIDPRLSKFVSIDKKHTTYVFTKSRNGKIDVNHHWEIEDTVKWPDGDYTITVWVRNIRRSLGGPTPPEMNEREYNAMCSVVTDGQNRIVRVTQKFE